MIRQLRITNIGKASMPITYNFLDDINIVTGKNGAGKTTFLKIAWYIFSGNLEMLAREVKFEKVELETDRYVIKIVNKLKDKEQKENLLDASNRSTNFKRKRDTYSNKYSYSISIDVDIYDKLEELELLEGIEEMEMDEFKELISNLNKESLLFTTFRRIEGGFLTEEYGDNTYLSRYSLESSLNNLSEKISSSEHKFITSISTVDIVNLITKKYADISEEINKNYIEYSKEIENKILAHSTDGNLSDQVLLEQANKVLQDVESNINKATEFRKELLKPFDVLNHIIGEIFVKKGIEVTENVTLGKSKETILSNSLSAGEKQMLSFICYNSFYKDSVIFIDEPEISLHVDWQRILIETLISQNSGNQFIIATHSPFIYSNYTDKEIVLDEDRGGF